MIDIDKFDTKLERYVEDFATFSKQEREETVEEIHNILMVCFIPKSSYEQVIREKVLDEAIDAIENQRDHEEFLLSRLQKDIVEDILDSIRHRNNQGDQNDK